MRSIAIPQKKVSHLEHPIQLYFRDTKHLKLLYYFMI
jgi:hypothetical protein